MACSYQKVTPRREDALQFQAHRAALDDSTDAYIIRYPTPPPFEIGTSNAVLAPFFSAILHTRNTDRTAYYILGQRPSGGTTLRTVRPDGTNANLGEGPPPALDAFVEALRLKA